jgi:hypothetical protein
VPESAAVSGFEGLKADPGKAGVENLSPVAEAVVEQPDGIVREVIFSQVKEETFHNLVTEFRASGPELRLLRQTVMQPTTNCACLKNWSTR